MTLDHPDVEWRSSMRTYFAFSVKPVHCPLTATIAVERTRMWKPIIFEWLRRCGLNGTSDIYTVGLQFQIWFVVSSFIHSLISSSDYGMCGMKRRVHPDSSSSNIVCTASASSVHGHCISCSELGLACILTVCAHTTAWTLHIGWHTTSCYEWFMQIRILILLAHIFWKEGSTGKKGTMIYCQRWQHLFRMEQVSAIIWIPRQIESRTDWQLMNYIRSRSKFSKVRTYCPTN